MAKQWYDVLREQDEACEAAARRMMGRRQVAVAAVLSTGREVRETDAGAYEVQPRGSNSWVEFDDLDAAVRAGEGR